MTNASIGWRRWLYGLLLFSLLPAAGGTAGSAPARAVAAPAAQDAQQGGVTRATVDAALPKLEETVRRVMESTGVPGMAVGVVFADEVVFLKGFGVREAGQPETVDADTVFQLASLSKPIASTVVAALVGKEVVSWDDRIADLYPDFRLFDPLATQEVTIRDLFSHRSGLPEYAGDLLEDVGYDRDQVIHRLRYLPPATSFRSSYAYTNLGLTAAAEGAARAAGMSWEELAQEKLYGPLGMTSTSSRYADFVGRDNRAPGHVPVDGQWVPKYARQPDVQSPAGGVSSSVRDLAQWLRLQLGGGTVDGEPVVDAAALAETHRPQAISHRPVDPSVDQAGFYGLGWNVGYGDGGGVRLGHSGAFLLGTGTAVGLLPRQQVGIVVLTNGAPVGGAETVVNSFLDTLLYGEPRLDWLAFYEPIFADMSVPVYGRAAAFYQESPADPLPALPSAAYTGVYANDYFGELFVREEGGGLVMEIGPAPTAFALSHWSRDVFTYTPDWESGYTPSAVTFTINPQGVAGSVMLENLARTGLGSFTRCAGSLDAYDCGGEE